MSTVYRSGVAVSRLDGRFRPPVTKHWRELFPRRQFVDLVNAAFARVERLNSPPRGQPFVDKGVPYASDDEFIEDLCEELRSQLRSYLKEAGKDLM